MHKSLTISGYNRPDYFARVLSALAGCHGVSEYRVTAILDPSDRTSELVELARGHGIHVHVCPRHLGCGAAILYAMTYGFDQSDFHIHLEDDTVPSPDALEWFQWARHHTKALTISGYNQHGGDAAENTFGYRPWFTPWGWATWKNTFEKHLRPAWDPLFWDGGVQRVRERLGMGEMYPCVSRIQNIGAERGTFCPGPEFHREQQHATRVATGHTSKWILA